MVKNWKTLSLEQVAQAWEAALAGLKKDDDHNVILSVVNLSIMLRGDTSEALTLLNEYEKRTDEGFFSNSEQTTLAYCQAASIYSNLCIDDTQKDKIYLLTQKAADNARTDTEEDIESVVECIGAEYSGAHIGDIETAQKLLDAFLEKIENKKMRTKIKKKVQKTISDF